MSDDRVWLHYPDTDGYFHCPKAAVDGWVGRGWLPSEPPAEVNLATVDQPKPEPPAPAEETKPSKATKAAGTAPEES